ncbi:ArdC-like ssDNA-binding domain-containing protein [Actinotignum urinale]|uniref:ArdC-like ssDNA-binding domain-containing protein n=1 Tax=Actinotignum urinale TaxID=190146 RepID=UPI002A7FF5B9|nr:ArdC-like ssDNA-binding domain-containing protein [Actinotignum urinale]MDY5129814.1 ArdC-like ssDNA-binding domain-containing protein [Actinotignum urinale]
MTTEPTTTFIDESGYRTEEWRDNEGRLHRDGKPALIAYRENGNIEHEEYYKHGMPYRENGPATIYYNKDGSTRYEEYFRDGLPFNDNPPSVYKESRYPNGSLEYVAWVNSENRLHREDGPAYTHFDEYGAIDRQDYRRHGLLHRENGPAYLESYPQGPIRYEGYYINDDLHREDGPAYLEYDIEGRVIREDYYVNGLPTPTPELAPVHDEPLGQADSVDATLDGQHGSTHEGAPLDNEPSSVFVDLEDMDNVDTKELAQYFSSQLERKIENLASSTDPEEFKKFLALQAALPDYSFRNALLIASQQRHRGLTVGEPVAGYKKWAEVGRQVAKGQKSIRIIAPYTKKLPVDKDTREVIEDITNVDPNSYVMEDRVVGFRAVPVFSLSQTDGEPINLSPYKVELLQGDGNDAVYNHMVSFAHNHGFSVKDVPSAGSINGANGQTNYTTKTISIRQDMSAAQRLKTLIHECAHMLLHDPQKIGNTYHNHRGRYEVEAESVAFTVASSIGIDTSDYSVGYIKGWARGDTKVFTSVLDTVQKTSVKILDTMKTIQPSITHTPHRTVDDVKTTFKEKLDTIRENNAERNQQRVQQQRRKQSWRR